MEIYELYLRNFLDQQVLMLLELKEAEHQELQCRLLLLLKADSELQEHS